MMLGNLMENALHAVCALPIDAREVTVISSMISGAMLGLSVDDGADEIRDYLRRYPALNFPVVWRLAPGSDDGLARSKGTPTTYVVDRQGNIVFKRFGQLRDEHYAYIESLLGAKR